MTSEFALYPKSPYNFKWNAIFFGQFKNNVIDVWVQPSIDSCGCYYRAFNIGNDVCLVRVSQSGDANKPKLKINILKGNYSQEIYKILTKIFRINDELKEILPYSRERPCYVTAY